MAENEMKAMCGLPVEVRSTAQLSGTRGMPLELVAVARRSLLWSVERAKLVAIWIAHIGQVHSPHLALTQPWWFFDRGSTVRHSYIVEVPHLLW